MITVEIVLSSEASATSLPLDATKEEILDAINKDSWIDFPCQDSIGPCVVCVPTELIRTTCPIVIREVE
jgi:hypothetical protein